MFGLSVMPACLHSCLESGFIHLIHSGLSQWTSEQADRRGYSSGFHTCPTQADGHCHEPGGFGLGDPLADRGKLNLAPESFPSFRVEAFAVVPVMK